MGKGLTLILGGARSGKSNYAEQLAAQRGKRVAYVATAQAWDDEMALRIRNHQAQRAAHWITVEASQQVGATVAAAEAAAHAAGEAWEVVLVDCLTLLASNVILALPEPVETPAAEAALRVEVDALLAAYAASNASWILVSNEVGLGIVPAYPLGRVYRDALGRANQQLAAMADEVLFMVAGLPMRVK
ncbi:MAG: bifunctional adenosylcobinamide kinase/adenosylcobinamide-phosphate guanylyltransferase [Caldilineaceae bacterium]|nr:bifunctional adenosylcobinamide kinase/adenosylcobinamide-phosphate guanylyltransferase [Caldilineaceae bacterium]